MFRAMLSCCYAGSLVAALLAAPAAAQIVFQPPLGSDGGIYAQRVAIGDVTGDDLPDALVSHFFLGVPPMLSPGQPGGSFGPPQLIPGLTSIHEVARLADFDEDGHLDLLVFGFFGTPVVAVLFGDGRGGFGTPLSVHHPAHGAPVDADVGDFDADGNLDIAIHSTLASFGQFGGISVRRGNGDGTFGAAVIVLAFTTPGEATADLLRVGDTNGDGFDDIVFESDAEVLLSHGDGTFEPAPCPGGCDNFVSTDLELADVNGDGRDDALTPSAVYLAQPDGSLAAPLPLATEFFHSSIAAGDFDADGLIDLAIGRRDTESFFNPDSTFGDVIVLRGRGDGSFPTTGVVVSHVPEPFGIAVADVDLDGRLDAVVGSQVETAPTIRTLLNHTYPVGSPFTDLGGALGGSNGYPIQLASGTLVAGQPFSFKLFNGPPSGLAFHIVGFAALEAPFKGGLLIPFPHLVNGPLPLNPSGAIDLAANWPAGGSGLTLWVQFWMPNGGGPVGFVASSGVRAQIP